MGHSGSQHISQKESHDPTRGPGNKMPPMYLKEGDPQAGSHDVISVNLKAPSTLRKNMFSSPFIHKSMDHSKNKMSGSLTLRREQFQCTEKKPSSSL